jgi:hypothetical protein
MTACATGSNVTVAQSSRQAKGHAPSPSEVEFNCILKYINDDLCTYYTSLIYIIIFPQALILFFFASILI